VTASAGGIAPERAPAPPESVLALTSPIVKLGIAVAWLFGLALTNRIGPPLVLAAVALWSGIALGEIDPARLVRRAVPLIVAALAVALANLLFSGAAADPTASELLRLGPIRVTAESLAAAAGLGARVVAIVAVGTVFTMTTTPTRLADSLVQQARVSARFAYGALAAYQAVPRLSDDLVTLRAARRLRGLRLGWHPRILVALLVRAIRHADQLAIAMDARGFGSGPRTSYRPLTWRLRDVLAGAIGLVALVAALAFA
jgi:energy-coupling factor transport system permease protein